MQSRLPCCVLLFALVGGALFPVAAAAEPTAADKETARALVLEGRAKLAAGDRQGALKALLAAHAIMGVPTTGLDLAKAQAAARLLVEARATALEVTRMPAAPGEPRAFTNARPAAAQLAKELEARIPSLLVRVTGPDAASVTVDGAAVPTEALGMPRKLNPGDHALVVSAPGFLTAQRAVRLRETETRTIEIALSPASADADADHRGAGVPAWAWASGAAGLAALGVGVAFAVDHASARSTVAEDCPGDRCDPARYDAQGIEDIRARWNRDLGLALGFGAAALVGVGAAVYGIVTAPTSTQPGAEPDVAIVTPWFAPGAVGVTFGRAF